MSKEKGNVNILRVGAANPGATLVTNKKDPQPTGPQQLRDDTTTDDSTGKDHAVIYAGNVEKLVVEQLVDLADASYAFLLARAKDGASFFVRWSEDGEAGGGTKPRADFSATVDAAPMRPVNGMARVKWTIEAQGGTTWNFWP